MALWHLVEPADWQLALARGEHAPPSLSREGFVHLSTDAQWLRSAGRFFAHAEALLRLEIDEERVGGAVRFEPADGELFPHLYAPLPVDAVRAVIPVSRNAAGQWCAET